MRKIDNETTEDNLYDMVDYVCIKLQKDCLAEKRIIYCEVADSQNTGIRWGSTGQPTGDRYRYLENDSKDDNRYIYLNDDSYKTVSSRYRGERTAITVNNTIAAQTTSDYDTEYFVTDLLGSVSCITGPTGSLKSSFSYDAFGSLVQGKLTGTSDFGYLGKQKDPTSTLYNYGYRDYTPQLSRFTTPDPIRDGPNWFSYCNSDPVNFVDPDGLFYYGADGQKSITTVKETTVVILREDDGLGNSFNSSRLIYKNDGINTKLVYVDTVGANCKPEYNGTKGSTTPDGTYYLSNKQLKKQANGTYNSNSYNNVLSLMTDDSSLTNEQKDEINKGDRLFHANQFADSQDPYNSNLEPGSAGCIIGKDGQKQQDEMMKKLMDGVKNPESIKVLIRSMKHEGCTE